MRKGMGSLALLIVLAARAGLGFAGEARPLHPPSVLDAEYRLAQHYDIGDTVPQNFALAAYWYHHAAERGYAPAQLALAQCYERGRGVAPDPVLAYMWADLAASRMDRETPEGDFAQGYRDYTRSRLRAPDVLQAQEMATAWRPVDVAVAGP
jgi:TPR repeat protein